MQKKQRRIARSNKRNNISSTSCNNSSINNTSNHKCRSIVWRKRNNQTSARSKRDA